MRMREWAGHGRKGRDSQVAVKSKKGAIQPSQGSAETRNTMTYESGYAYESIQII